MRSDGAKGRAPTASSNNVETGGKAAGTPAEELDAASGPDYEDKVTKFYLIPPMVLSRLYDDFSSLVGDKRTRLILHQAGYRCGSKMAEGLDIDTADRELMEGALQELLIQLGLGVLRIEEYSGNRVVVSCVDSNEARAMGKRDHPACNFTTGYIRGLLEGLLSVKFNAAEEACASLGAPKCRFVYTWPA